VSVLCKKTHAQQHAQNNTLTETAVRHSEQKGIVSAIINKHNNTTHTRKDTNKHTTHLLRLPFAPANKKASLQAIKLHDKGKLNTSKN
jgi:hypothetical protein